MARNDLIAFRVSTSEREELKALAARLERTESDAARYAIRQLVRQLVEREPTPPAPATAQRAA